MKRIRNRIISAVLVLSVIAQLFCGISLTAFAGSGKFLSFAFENFNSGRENLVLSGLSDAVPDTYAQYDVRAAYQGDHINLTPKVWTPGIGTAAYKEKIALPDDMSFSTYFTFDMSGPVNDGFVYTFNCDRNTSPTSWNSIGMSTSETAINIEFDTSNGGGGVQDTDANHIAVTISNSALRNVGYYSLDSAVMNLQDTRLKHAWIEYDGASNKLYVTVSYTDSRADGVKAEFDFSSFSTENLFAETLSSNEVYTGFTSITYNTDSPKNINSWYFVNKYEPIDLKNNTYAKCVAGLNIFAIAESGSEGTITISAVDSENAPVAGAELTVSSVAGLFSQQKVITDENGEAVINVSGENLAGSNISVSAVGGVVKSTSSFLVKGEDRAISIAYSDFGNAAKNELLVLSGLSDAEPNPYEPYNVRAGIENGVLKLTSKTNFAPVLGAAYYKNKLAVGEDMSFSTYFSFAITPGSNYGDGFAFVLNETTNQMTLQRTSMAIPSGINNLSVEFDTYYNSENNDAQPGGNNHIAVNINGEIASTPSERRKSLSDITLADGKMKHAWIDYDGANKTMTVTVSNSIDKAAGEQLSVSDIDLNSIFTSNMLYAGFVGGHGNGSGQNHDIYNWYFDGEYAPIDIRTANYEMLPASIEVQAVTYDLATAEVTVKVTDYDGAPAVGIPLSLSSDVGTLSPASGVTDASGCLTSTLTGNDLTGAVVTAALSSGASKSAVVKVAENPLSLVAAYPNFDRIATNNLLNLTGGNYTAEIKNAQLVLTEDDTSETAGAFLKKKIALASDNSFSTYFTFNISGRDTSGDGLAFVIGNKYNTSGYNGVSGTASLSENIAIEFDTFLNEAHADPDSNHIGYNLNGSVSSAAVLSLSNIRLADGRTKHVWIDYNGAEDKLTVVISNTADKNSGEKLTVERANVASALTSNEVYAGFTASTGSVSSRHSISSWYFDNSYNPIDTAVLSDYQFDYTNVNITADKLYDISDTASLRVRLVDLQGNPVSRREVAFTTDRGLLDVERAVTDADGYINFVYTNTGSKAGAAEIKAVTSDGFIGEILLECLAATAAENKEISFAYDSFGMNDMNKLIRLSGGTEDKKATISDGVLRLTPNTSGQTTGAAYYVNKISLGGDYSFGTMFTFRVTPGSGAADGFTFTLNNSYNELSAQRHSMGMPQIAGSISVEFDTYRNPEHNDPSDNHISVDINGNPTSCPNDYKLDLNGSGIKLSDGNTKYAWIFYDGSQKQFTVIVSNTSNPDAGKRLDVSLDLSTVLTSDEVYAGFTAEHYGSGEQHDITSWYFDNENAVLDAVSTVYTTGAVEVSAKTTAVSENKVRLDVSAADYLGRPESGCDITVLTDKGVLQDSVITTDENGKAVTYITGGSLVGATIKFIADGGAFTEETIGSLGISLIGDSEVIINLGDSYIEQGATAYDLIEGDLTDRISVSGHVDTAKKGVYEITYSVENSSGATASVIRTVRVQDVTPPVLKLLGKPELTVEGGMKYIDAGASATDGCDGDITTEIFVYGYVDIKKVGTYVLAYEVSDYSGNAAVPVYRTVKVVDTTPPVITLKGDATVYIEQYDTYIDAGVTISDNVDNSFWINRRVKVSGSVNTDVLGSYLITYNVTDESGNSATATRTVMVVKKGTLGDYSSSPKTNDSAAPNAVSFILILGVFSVIVFRKKFGKRGMHQ